MQNYQHFQNPPNFQFKRSPTHKIVLNNQGKISLSKSTKVNSQISAKNQQINTLKSQVLHLKFKLEKQKAQSKKVSLLSNEIRKIKQKLIDKVNEKKLRQRKNPQQLSDEAISFSFGSSFQQLKNDDFTVIQQKQHEVNEQMKQSTYKIFQNFSLFNSASKKSYPQRLNGFETRLIQSQQKPFLQQQQEDDFIRQETISKIKGNRQKLNRMKFKKDTGSFFQQKTIKNDNQNEYVARPQKLFYYDKYEQQTSHPNKNNLEQTKKFSIVNFKKKMKK